MIQDAQNEESLAIGLEPEGKRLSRAEFQGLGDMPPELEWFANLDNPRTRRAYRRDVKEFTAFAGVEQPAEMRQVTRAHLIAWRKDLERRGLAPSSIESGRFRGVQGATFCGGCRTPGYQPRNTSSPSPPAHPGTDLQ